MLKEINRKLNECIRAKKDFNKIEFSNDNFDRITKDRKEIKKKIEFYINLRRALNKYER